jgi:SSS family solute:Na+ symporter
MMAATGFTSPIYTIHLGGMAVTAYAGVFALALNLIVAIAFTPVCDFLGIRRWEDKTRAEDYNEELIEG